MKRLPLGQLAGPLADAARKATEQDLRAIGRAQRLETWSAAVIDGQLEGTSSGRREGAGLQVFDAEGRSALAATEQAEADRVRDLPERAAGIVRALGRRGVGGGAPPTETPPLRAEVPPLGSVGWSELDPARLEQRAVALGRELAARHGKDVNVRLSVSLTREEWRIVRWDGTDAGFVLPRTVVSVGLSRRGGGATVSTRAQLARGRWDLFERDEDLELLRLRAERAAARLADIAAAAAPPSGALPLVIDHALAKGLAHEALGHAAEADAFRSSILARDGRLRRGERVAGEAVSVVDEPVVGDHAFQPISAHGVARRLVRIVRAGLVDEALTDLFSAAEAGAPLRGAARAATHADPPLPRMSNIRIEVAEPRPLPDRAEALPPAAVRDLLGEAGVLDRHPEVVLLCGYTGGQVNATTGSFVFGSEASYRLRADRVEPCQPAVFSGDALTALGAIEIAFGGLLLDVAGQCGKAGQGVPSSGGSHAFLYLAPRPGVLVGGRSGP